MNDTYIYQKPPRRSRYAAFRRRLKLIIGVLAAIILIGVFIYVNLRGGQKPPPAISPVQSSVISDNKQVFTGPYFKFSDTGKWVLDKASTTANRFTYIDYLGQEIEGQLNIYVDVNNVPLPIEPVSRALPVRIVNDNSFQVTGVTDPCANQYPPGAQQVDKNVTVDNSGIYCDPGTPQYSVVFSEIGGDYHLPLKRANGAPINFEITYLNQDINPQPDNLLNIASSFQAL
jgi:hypothetical protein